MNGQAPQLTPNQLAIQQQQTPEQAAQYPGFQEATGLNGKMAGRVIELANRVNTAQDIKARHPGLDPAILEKDISDAYGHLDRHIGHLAAGNIAQRSAEVTPTGPTPDSHNPQSPRVVNDDGRMVAYGQMARAIGGGRHPQAGRMIFR